MEFGVFDHLDANEVPLQRFYDERLRVVEEYERAGFSRYHVAEHHSTPLGMAPSPSVYLASVAQRTRRLRFGPLVYLLPLYHPLRLAEEIAMLDNLSGGRYDVGIGRGISPIESMLYGRDPAESQPVFDEVLAVLHLFFERDVVTFQGEHFRFDNVPVVIRPVQRPHPPLWYGISSPEGAARCAERRCSGVTLNAGARGREIVKTFFRTLGETGTEDLKMGICRFVVVGESDAEAYAVGTRAFPLWHRHFHHLYRAYGRSPVHGVRPDFDGMIELGMAVAGSPETVASGLRSQLLDTDANYFVGQFVFGDMTLRESLTSIGLFAERVMPELRSLSPTGGVR